MGEPVEFHVAGRPVPQGSMMAAVTRSGQPYLRASNAGALREWRNTVKAAAKAAMGDRAPLVGGLQCVLTFGLHRPESYGTRVVHPIAKNVGDIDKFMRAVFDALTGVVYVDDGQVESGSVRKCWAGVNTDDPPGVLVWIDHVPGYPDHMTPR